jgi:nicotinate phosphoribosyltransferase
MGWRAVETRDTASVPIGMSTALFTDRYELTMLDVALRSGMAGRRVTFEVFARRLPPGRTHGVLAGLDRVIDALGKFSFGPAELDWLAGLGIVSPEAIDWLGGYRFNGSIIAYREGELYAAGSPVMTIQGTFGQAVLLETLVLSILNHDAAVAAAAEQIVQVAGGRRLIEMGSRRTDPVAAVASARAAYLAGFASTSNLEAGRTYGIPTAGTAAHSFIMAYPSETEAFSAQLEAYGTDTTLLVDTYDIERGIRNAVAMAGPALGAVRIDSGDPATEVRRARALLDQLGATATRIVVTGDLDRESIAKLASEPADAYGVGTSLVTGLGSPTAGFVYKLVSIAKDDGDDEEPVSKQSEGKATVGGRKWAWRLLKSGRAVGEEVSTEPVPPESECRALQSVVVADGEILDRPTLEEAREHHRMASAELPAGEMLPLHLRS